MNAYRIALILCRAAIIALWLRAVLGLIGGAVVTLATHFGMFGTRLSGIAASLLMPLGSFVFAALIATLLGFFAPSLCASATGRASLEGESLSSRRCLDAQEKSLAWTGAGFIVLFSAAASILPSLLIIIYQLFFTSTLSTSSVGRDVMMYNLASSFVPLSLHCVVGFALAFRSDLRHIVKPDENV